MLLVCSVFILKVYIVSKIQTFIPKLNIVDDGLPITPCLSGYPGFYQIPGFRKYSINKNGVLHRCDRPGVFLKAHPRSNHASTPKDKLYYGFSIYDDNGVLKTVLRHRCVLAAHKGFSDDPTKFTVNHINGIGGDDRLENLEWMSVEENLLDAIDRGARADLAPIERWHIESGEITRYSTVPEFVRQTGMPKGTILKRLAKDNGQIYRDGCRYRYIRDKWSDTPQSYFEKKRNTMGKAMLVLDYRDSQIHEFESGYHAARHYGIPRPYSVNQSARKEHTIPFYGCIFRFKTDTPPKWPRASADQRRALKMQGYPEHLRSWIKLLDGETGKEVFFGSFEDAVQVTNRKIDYLRTASSNNYMVNGYYPIAIQRKYRY